MDSDPSLQIIINRESNDYRVVGADPMDLKVTINVITKYYY